MYSRTTAFAVGGAVLLLLGGLAGYLYGVDSTPTKTITTVSTTEATLTTTSTSVSTSLIAYDQQVTDSFAKHMLLLSERNATAIVSQYEENATVTWMGQTNGLGGFYNGTKVIFILMNVSFIGRGGSISIGNAAHRIMEMPGDSAMLNSSFAIHVRDYGVGLQGRFVTTFNATISAQDLFVYSASNHAWLISQETWNFTNFNSE
jgi:hypothetical protein